MIPAWILSMVPGAINCVKWLLGCQRCLIGLAFVAVAVSSNWLGQHKARTECQEAQLHARIAIQRDDLDKANRAAADAKLRAAKIEGDSDDQRKRDQDYIARLESRPACNLTDADIGGLPNHKQRNGARSAAPAR